MPLRFAGLNFPDEVTRKLLDAISGTVKDGLERGLRVCGTCAEVRSTSKICAGSVCRVPKSTWCTEGVDRSLFDFHTHPGRDVFPSPGDLLALIEEYKLGHTQYPIGCRGNSYKVRCEVLKKDIPAKKYAEFLEKYNSVRTAYDDWEKTGVPPSDGRWTTLVQVGRDLLPYFRSYETSTEKLRASLESRE